MFMFDPETDPALALVLPAKFPLVPVRLENKVSDAVKSGAAIYLIFFGSAVDTDFPATEVAPPAIAAICSNALPPPSIIELLELPIAPALCIFIISGFKLEVDPEPSRPSGSFTSPIPINLLAATNTPAARATAPTPSNGFRAKA